MASTQEQYPWRATARTAFAAVPALAAGVPLIVAAAGVPEATAGVGVILAVSAAITRVMALPWTEQFLAQFVPWLAAKPTDRG